METPTIVRKTRDYILVKIPLSRGDISAVRASPKNGKMTIAEKRLWKNLQEAEKDVKRGRVITAPSIDVALKRYAKRQWG